MEQQKKKSLSEISHLFLSSVRDNATGGARPTRIPPGGERVATRPGVPPTPRSAMSIDLTPEEYARVISQSEANEAAEDAVIAAERPPLGPVSALICSQFNSHQIDRAKEYARHLAATGERVGLIQVDAAECSVITFETVRMDLASESEVEPAVARHPREMSEALEELAWDIDRWVLLLTSPRSAEARLLLKKVQHWVLLSTCDHDGVVSCYRAIKGLAEMPRPRLTLALLNAADQVEAGSVYRKIAGVCEQFLSWKMEAEPAVEPVDLISEHLTLVYHPSKDRVQLAAGPHWEVVADFLAMAEEAADETTKRSVEKPLPLESATSSEESSMRIEPLESPVIKEPTARVEASVRVEPAWEKPKLNAEVKPVSLATALPLAAPNLSAEIFKDDDCDVTDLPNGEVTEAAVLSAVMAKTASGLVECPIHPPACPQAALAVNRDRRLVLLAVARKGLGELRAIATAYRWVMENRPLLSMALPQFAVDTHAMPSLKLLVDRADAGAELLLPMTENGNVTVQTYRKLRWAGKTGLLLEAA